MKYEKEVQIAKPREENQLQGSSGVTQSTNYYVVHIYIHPLIWHLEAILNARNNREAILC